MTDSVQSAIHVALKGLTDRQKVVSDNLANVQTPGYLAKETDFETSLRAALNGDKSADLNPTYKTSTAETRVDGNNVNLDDETVTAMDTELKYQTMVEAMNTKFRLLRTAIGA